jgi:hypothetical protein
MDSTQGITPAPTSYPTPSPIIKSEERLDGKYKKPAFFKAGFHIWWVVSDSNARPTD